MPVVESEKDAMDLFLKGLSGEDETVVNIFAINTALAIHNCRGTEMKEAFEIAKNEITSGRSMDKLRSLTA
jgi:anthranilate phosphoribosyltransferase